jgi:hypothetical protein
MDLFVQAFMDEMQKLSMEGITVTLGNGRIIKCNVTVLQLVADLPAKTQLINQLQYNGLFGCSKRLHPGVHLENTTVCFYLFEEYPLRTAESVYGVKGRSSLSSVA